MEIKQNTGFEPITIILNTREEAVAFATMVDHYDTPDGYDLTQAFKDAYRLSVELSDWFCNEGKGL